MSTTTAITIINKLHPERPDVEEDFGAAEHYRKKVERTVWRNGYFDHIRDGLLHMIRTPQGPVYYVPYSFATGGAWHCEVTWGLQVMIDTSGGRKPVWHFAANSKETSPRRFELRREASRIIKEESEPQHKFPSAS